MLENYDYTVISTIASVRYITDDNFQCEIVLTNGYRPMNGPMSDQTVPNFEYRSKNATICEFADRRKHCVVPVRVYAISFSEPHSFSGVQNIVDIESADPDGEHGKC